MTVRKEALVEYFGRRLDEWSWLKGVSENDLYNELVSCGGAPYKTRPWKHQLAYLLLMQTLDRGGGKTKIVLDDVTTKMRQGRAFRTLVVVPNALNIDTWCRAAAEHSDLSVWPVDCPNIAEKWERLSAPLGDITVVDYAGLALAVLDRKKKVKKKLVGDRRRVAALADTYDIVVFDEVHKLKNRASTWHAIAKSIADRVPYVYGLTGTLFGRDAEEAWAVTSVIDGGETFGTLGLFRSAFFDAKPNPWTGVEYKLNAKKSPVLHTMLQHRSLRYDEHELLELPHREDRVIRLDFPDE
jgi:SNF2-related domain